MWINSQQGIDSVDQIFNDLVGECKYLAPTNYITYGLRKRLEKYPIDKRKQIVSRMIDGCAPLFLACKAGHIGLVEYLITTCGADIEQRGRYEIPNDRSVHCVTPLWCAAVSGNLPVIKCLISHGADVNAVSDTGSTPIRSACFMTYMDVVLYLMENGADIHKTNYNGGTCLINSVQSVELCSLLLRHGADINAADIQNKTALHYAIQEQRLETTKLLLEHNADPYLKSRYNDDALQTACLKGAKEIFAYLAKEVPYSAERLADANELMGSTFFDELYDTQEALNYWRAGMEIRNANLVDGKPLPKRPVLPTREVYQNMTEFQTLEELNSFATDRDVIRIQSLLICERILGPYHKDTLFKLMYRGASYADTLRFQACIDLWRRALEIRVEKDTILYNETCFNAQALVRLMIDLNEKPMEMSERNPDKREPRFSDVVAVFELLSSKLTEAKKLLQIRPVHERQRDSYDRILKCITHLIYLLVGTADTDDKKSLTNRLVYTLLRQNPKTALTEDTLLHLCVSSLNTISSTYFTADDIQTIFPHLEVVKLLLECGAQVNARNKSGSTPLHIASNSCNFNNTLIKFLLENGAHPDIPNKAGDTPAQMISSNSHNTVNLMQHVTLQCHAANAICKYGINYKNELPVSLHYFINLHRE